MRSDDIVLLLSVFNFILIAFMCFLNAERHKYKFMTEELREELKKYRGRGR